MENQKIDLLSLYESELEEFIISIGEPKYRAGQMFPQLHKGLSPEEMTNIGKKTREKLSEVAEYHLPQVRRKLVSALDGTVKYLFELRDGHCVESVVMRYNHGNTICISSQVGCRMGCKFCASTIGGRVRDLTPGEPLGQVIAAQKDLGERISNIVMMGIGEPLDNYDNVISTVSDQLVSLRRDVVTSENSNYFIAQNISQIPCFTQKLKSIFANYITLAICQHIKGYFAQPRVR